VPGKVRVKQGGGAAGHNGLRSIDAHLGPAYWRIRLGVGHPGSPELVKAYVLQDFAKDEQPLIGTMIEAVVQALPLLLAGDANGFMSKVDVSVNPPRPKPPRPDAAGEAKAKPGSDKSNGGHSA
jgi:PTH1 family peptidyl-tRNA hydrolase